MAIGEDLRHRVPIAGGEVRVHALAYPRCRVFQPRRLRSQFVKARERGVKVCLVEDFAAASQVAFDREEVDHPPLGVEAVLRSPASNISDDRSEVAQPMDSLDVVVQAWCEI